MSSSKHSPHLIMPFPLSIHAQEKQRARIGLVVLASTFLAAVALLAFLNEYSEPALQIDALELKDGFTVAQIGQYGMRADRQARNFELGELPPALQPFLAAHSHRAFYYLVGCLFLRCRPVPSLQTPSAALTKPQRCVHPLPLKYQPVVCIVLIGSTGTKSSDTDAASAQLEKNARQSAFLAADQKNQIKELISTLPLP